MGTEIGPARLSRTPRSWFSRSCDGVLAILRRRVAGGCLGEPPRRRARAWSFGCRPPSGRAADSTVGSSLNPSLHHNGHYGV